MIQIIYDFILNVFIGDTTIENVDTLASLLTFASIILIFFCLVKLTLWCFSVFKNGKNNKWY